MGAFKSLIVLLLPREGYWTQTSYKVELTKAEKRTIGRPSSPRWEIDLVAYKGVGNDVLAIECKSNLDSSGVRFEGGAFQPPERYKLFTGPKLRIVVLNRLGKQLEDSEACDRNPTVRLCLAVGKVAPSSDRAGLDALF
ncbi:unnamed protein product [marine sediment metagenome]|uniref:Uncharacterized protein n=1 Tax=marine sediment metagenome TaxID=412755 RepID=X0VBM9_9ZZZZ